MGQANIGSPLLLASPLDRVLVARLRRSGFVACRTHTVLEVSSKRSCGYHIASSGINGEPGWNSR